jgi:uncharacterized Zn-finger protein
LFIVKYEQYELDAYNASIADSKSKAKYQFVGVFPVNTETYLAWSDNSALDPNVDLATLENSTQTHCPYCDNLDMGVCQCQKIFCIKGWGMATCPWCKHRGLYFGRAYNVRGGVG